MTAGRPRSEARDIALMLGDKFYEGSQCVTCGTTIRYVTGSRCVMCAREVAAKRATARRKPKLATPKQRRIVGKYPPIQRHPAAEGSPSREPVGTYQIIPADARIVMRNDVEAGTRAVAAVELEQRIEQIAAREREITAEEVARAKVLSDLQAIETGGLTLCGVAVTELEMAEYIRTGIVPNRIMQKDNSDG